MCIRDRPDAELIVLSQQGDETAFAQLVQRYQNKVYTLAVHLLGDREEGRDAAQEVFIRVYNGMCIRDSVCPFIFFVFFGLSDIFLCCAFSFNCLFFFYRFLDYLICHL